MNRSAGALDMVFVQELIDAVAVGFEEQLDFTQEMIRSPSLRGQEASAQLLFEEALKTRGYEVDRWAIDVDDIMHHPGFSPVEVDYANAVNVVGQHSPRNVVGRSLILNGHIDVVPTGPIEMWSTPPFEPYIDGDWLYGRGSADMKAGLCANVFALDAISRLGLQPASNVYVQSVTEEECTGNGALSALVRGYTADAAIIPEPEENMLVRANVGVIWLRIKVSGRPIHVREAGEGYNAIEAAYIVIDALKVLEKKWNGQKSQYPYFDTVDHPITINVGKIVGGDWPSSVPAWCNLDVRAAIYPGVDPSDAAAEIESCIYEASQRNTFLSKNMPEVEYTGFFARGYILEEGSDAELTLARNHNLSFGSTLESFVTPGYLDGRVFVLYDECPCLVYGPISKNIHAVDEAVSLSSLKNITGTIALFIADWCGLEKKKGPG